MKKHPGLGLEMLSDTATSDRSKNIVVQHHEKINGVGYPSGIQGESLPTTSQVVSLCDAYDAMTTTRCYSKAIKPVHALKILMNELRGHFNPNLIIHLIQLLNLKH